ncbi:MAG: type II secretion system GspH family protein [Opitutaceae bacterium]|nr:type II secretion system GspH family protein [Opitutaceae bacterium]
MKTAKPALPNAATGFPLIEPRRVFICQRRSSAPPLTRTSYEVLRAAPGFTLIELLTVIAIIGILVAIVLSTMGGVRQKANAAVCMSNLRQIHMGAQLYAQDNKGRLPPHYTTINGMGKSWYNILKDEYMNAPMVFFCKSSTLTPDLTNGTIKSGWSSYGRNVNLGFDPGLLIDSIVNPGKLILVADSDDASADKSYLDTSAAAKPGERHSGKIQLVHIDGSLIRVKRADLIADNANWKN